MFGVMRGSTWSPESISSWRRLVEAEVARRVAGRPDGLQVPPRHLRPRPVLEQQVGDDRVDQLAHRHGGVAQGLQLLRRRAHASQRGRHAVEQVVGLVVAVVDELGVGGVQRDPGARRLPDPAGQSVVVGVDVGHHDALHVADVAADLLHAAARARRRRRRCSSRRQSGRAPGPSRRRRPGRNAGSCSGAAPGCSTARGGPSRPRGRGRWPRRHHGRAGRGAGCACVWRDVEVTTVRSAPGEAPGRARR